MAIGKYFFICAFIYTVQCNPLAQTTVCESAQNFGGWSPTIFESTPNLPFYPYGLPWGGLGGAGLLPGGLGYSGLPYSGIRSITGLPGIGYLNSIYCLPLGLPYGLPAPLSIPVPAVPAVPAVSSTVYESAPVFGVGPVGGLPLPLSGLGLGGLGLGGLGPGVLGLGGLGLPAPGLGGLGYGLGPAALPLL